MSGARMQIQDVSHICFKFRSFKKRIVQLIKNRPLCSPLKNSRPQDSGIKFYRSFASALSKFQCFLSFIFIYFNHFSKVSKKFFVQKSFFLLLYLNVKYLIYFDELETNTETEQFKSYENMYKKHIPISDPSFF